MAKMKLKARNKIIKAELSLSKLSFRSMLTFEIENETNEAIKKSKKQRIS